MSAYWMNINITLITNAKMVEVEVSATYREIERSTVNEIYSENFRFCGLTENRTIITESNTNLSKYKPHTDRINRKQPTV